jgi:hypothetical protein
MEGVRCQGIGLEYFVQPNSLKDGWYLKSPGTKTMMKAHLLADEGGEVFPELVDAVMMFAEDGVMTIRGLERDPVTRKLSAMAWWCQVVRPGKRGYQSDPMGPTPV